MIKTVKLKNLISLCLIIYIDCHTFNQTRNVYRKIIGVNEIYIKKIQNIEKISSSDIRINTIAAYKDGSPINEQMCILITYDQYYDEYKFTQFKSNVIILEECVPLNNTEPLDFKIMKHYEYLKKIKEDNKTSKNKTIALPYKEDNKLFIPLGHDLVIIETKSKYQNKLRKYNDQVKKTAHIKPNYYYYPLFPLVLTYDLLAGTLHTAGMPFYYASEYGFYLAISESTNPRGFLRQTFVNTIFYTNFIIAAILISPDGVKIKPDIFDE
ncbi:hypothetical protein AB3N62_11150 [Leptospira sp. WS4.C2]